MPNRGDKNNGKEMRNLSGEWQIIWSDYGTMTNWKGTLWSNQGALKFRFYMNMVE